MLVGGKQTKPLGFATTEDAREHARKARAARIKQWMARSGVKATPKAKREKARIAKREKAEPKAKREAAEAKAKREKARKAKAKREAAEAEREAAEAKAKREKATMRKAEREAAKARKAEREAAKARKAEREAAEAEREKPKTAKREAAVPEVLADNRDLIRIINLIPRDLGGTTTSPEILLFRNFREKSCTVKTPIYERGHKRAKTDTSPYHKEDAIPGELEKSYGELLPSFSMKKSGARLKAWNKEFDSFFLDQPKYGILIKERNPMLDQTGAGACSLMGVMELFAIYGRLSELNDLTKSLRCGTKTKIGQTGKRAPWWKTWMEVRYEKEDASSGVALTLDRMHFGFKRPIPADFIYLPIVRMERESQMNPLFSGTSPKIQTSPLDVLLPDFFARNKVPDNWSTHPNLKGIFRKGALLEYLVRRQIPVIVNQGQHTRLAVAVSENEVLCVDSYGALWSSGNERWRWNDGFSVVGKWLLYTSVREMAFFDHPVEIPS
jgi:hypothetical protein